ncbi:MAG: hypothetical protein KDK66_06235, partial [Deltaproteobacteria bacterium]|nr:hypothetical protein [Deltaproteobacteria bacterium]
MSFSQTKVRMLLFCCVYFVGISSVQAHHAGGGAGSSSSISIQSTRQSLPRNQVYLNAGIDFLDGSLGEVFTYELQGEFAVHKRFSLGVRLPFEMVRMDLLPSSNHLGDVSLLTKGSLWHSSDERSYLTLGLETSFPTGNDQGGRGAGVVTMTPYLSFSTSTWVLDFYTNLSVSP